MVSDNPVPEAFFAGHAKLLYIQGHRQFCCCFGFKSIVTNHFCFHRFKGTFRYGITPTSCLFCPCFA